MRIDQQRGLEIRSLVFSARIRGTDLDHALATVVAGLESVHTQAEFVALDIEGLAGTVEVVQAVAADLDLDAAGLVLDIEGLVEVAGLVVRGDLAGDDQALRDLQRSAVIHLAELRDGVRRGHRDHRLGSGCIVLERHDRFPFLAGSEQQQTCGE